MSNLLDTNEYLYTKEIDLRNTTHLCCKIFYKMLGVTEIYSSIMDPNKFFIAAYEGLDIDKILH